MRTLLKMAMVAAAAVALVACRSEPVKQESKPLVGGKPVWVDKGMPDKPDPACIYAVGSATSNPNTMMRLAAARNSAKVGLGRSIETEVKSLVKNFMQSHKDHYAVDEASSIEFASSVSKELSAVKFGGFEQIESYEDAQKDLHVLYKLPKAEMYDHAAKLTVQMGDSPEATKAFKGQSGEAMKDLTKYVQQEKDKLAK